MVSDIALCLSVLTPGSKPVALFRATIDTSTTSVCVGGWVGLGGWPCGTLAVSH